MEKTINVLDKVDVHVNGLHVKVKGSQGELEKNFSDPRFNGIIKIEKEGDKIKISTDAKDRKKSAMVGTITAHIKNMMIGASVGYKYEMKILYTHFPITVAQAGDEIQVKNFFGEKSTRTARIAGKVQVKIEKEGITITGANVEEVGQTAANIEQACKLTKRDRRIFQDGIYLSKRLLKNGAHV
jgi:large subunit ribosomal protein L6